MQLFTGCRDIIFGRKNIVSMDLDLIRSVMVKEFPHFVNRLVRPERA